MKRKRSRIVAFLLAFVLIFSSISTSEGSVLNVLAENAEETKGESNTDNQEEPEKEEAKEEKDEGKEEVEEPEKEEVVEVEEPKKEEPSQEIVTEIVTEEESTEITTQTEEGSELSTEDETQLSTEDGTDITTEVETTEVTTEEETTEEMTTEEMTTEIAVDMLLEDTVIIYYEAGQGGSVDVEEEEVSLAEDADGPKGATAIADSGYSFVNWTLNGEEVSQSEKFVPEAKEARYIANFEEKMPKFEASQTVDGIKVIVTAKAGIIPRGASISVNAVVDNNVVSAVIGEMNTDEREIKNIYAFDITILNKNGEEIQPSGEVKVSFQNVDGNGEYIDVFHVEDGQHAENISDAIVESSDDKIAFTTDHFSVYVLARSDEAGVDRTNPYTLYPNQNLTIESKQDNGIDNWSISNDTSGKLSITETTAKTATIHASGLIEDKVVLIKHKYEENISLLGVYTYKLVKEEKFYVKTVALSITGNDRIYAGSSMNLQALSQGVVTDAVTWSSEDDSIATVDENGTVTAVRAGTVTIKAALEENVFATKEIQVMEAILATSIRIIPNPSFNEGEQSQTVVEILPENVTNDNIRWSSSDPSVVSINAITGLLTARKVGKAIITVEMLDGSGVTDSEEITVVPVKYNVTLKQSENGTIAFYEDYTSPYKAIKDSEVKFKVTPADGYYCTGVTASNDQKIVDCYNNIYSIQTLTNNTEVTATFTKSDYYKGSKAVKYFVLKPSRGIPGSADSQGQENYFPSSSDDGGINGCNDETGYRGGKITWKAAREIGLGAKAGKKELFNQSGFGDEYVKQPNELGDFNGKKINWYAIKNQDDGVHVDGYLLDVSVSIYYHENVDSTEEIYTENKKTGEEATTLHFDDIDSFTAKEGYTFAGWNTKPDGSGDAYPAGKVFTVMTGLDLYAQWSKSAYTITASAINGTIKESGEVKVGLHTDAIFQYEPYNDYILDYIEIDGIRIDTLVENATEYTFYDITMDHTITVVFQKNTPYRTISWLLEKPDGETTTIKEEEYEPGVEIATTDIPTVTDEMTMEGYTLVNAWETDTPQYMPKNNVEIVSYYQANSYPVTVNLHYSNKETETRIYNDGYFGNEFIYKIIEQPGYTVDQVKVKNEVAEVTDEISLEVTTSNNVIDIYYVYDLYTITFIAREHGSLLKDGFLFFDEETDTIKIEGITLNTESITAPTTIPDVNYEFAKWTDKDGNDVTLPTSGSDILSAVAANPSLTYYADFIEKEYTIKFRAPEKFALPENIKYSISSDGEVKFVEYDRVNLYTFQGWYAVPAEEVKETDSKLVKVQDVRDFILSDEKNTEKELRDITLYAKCTLDNPAKFFVRNDSVEPDESEIRDYDIHKYSEVADGSIDLDGVFNRATGLNTGYDGRYLKDLFGISVARGDEIDDMYTMTTSSFNTDKLNEELIQNGLTTYDPDTQYIKWYVIKFYNKDGYWHVDGVVVDKRELIYTVEPESVVYNGAEQTASTTTFTVTDSDGKSYTVSGVRASASGTTVGSYQVTSVTPDGTFKVIDNQTKEDVTQYYKFPTTEDVKGNLLTITKRPVSFTAGSRTWKYDGEEHVYHELADNGVENLVSGHTFDVTYSDESKITFVGEQSNVMTEVKIFADAQKSENVTRNYDITLHEGMLRVYHDEKIAITVTSANASKVYDGTELTHNVILPVQGLIKGDKVHAHVTGSQTNAFSGDGNNTLLPENVKVMHGNTDVTDYYDITVVSGTLKVEKRPIEFTASSASRAYDGIALTNQEYSYTEYNANGKTGLLPEHTIASVKVEGSIIMHGEVPNIISDAVIEDAAHNNMNDNYKISYQNGRLAIYDGEAIAITVRGLELSKIYDGTPLQAEQTDYTMTGELLAGDEIIVTIGTESVTNVADLKKQYSVNAIIRNKTTLEEVTNKYAIILNYGSLEIISKDLTVTASSESWEYDGIEHTLATFTSDGLLEEDRIVEGTVYTDGKIKLPGTAKNAINVTGIQIMNAENEDTTRNYHIIPVDGDLVVTMQALIPLTITASSGTKVYDGTVLNNHEYTYELNTNARAARVASTLVGDDQITDVVFDTVSSLTQAGTVDNIITGVTIKNGDDDVTKLYDITYVNGTLTVEKRPITFTAGSSQRRENGTPLTNPNYTITAGSLAEDSSDFVSSISVVGSITTRGSVANVISQASILNEEQIDVTDSYEITYVNGTLSLLARDGDGGGGGDDDDDDDDGGGGGTPPTNMANIDDGLVPLADGNTIVDGEVPLAAGLEGATGTNPQTSDNHHIVIWLVGLFVSMSVAGVYFFKRKKETEEK